MSGLLALKEGPVYGPVHSRRLGRSLGINPLGGGAKTCSFDCGYCQYGHERTTLAAPRLLPSVAEIREAVAGALARLPEPPAFLTFSGNGEPTLHPDFPALVTMLLELRDRHAPSARTAVLSNSSRVSVPEIHTALARLDVRIMKLDCGTEATFRRYNRPAPGLTLDTVVDALSNLGDVTVQALFTGGPGGNADPAEISAWLDGLDRIRPEAVQVYSLDRGWPDPALEPLPLPRLEAIAAAAIRRGHPAGAYGR